MKKDNPFKKINQPLQEVPAGLKEKVMKEIAAIKLTADMATLFTSNYKSTFGSLFFIKKKKKKNNN